jgi:hypothetical protein
MKTIFLSVLTLAFISCAKNDPTNSATAPASTTPKQTGGAPYGDSSIWKCIGGDTMFSEILKLKLYYTEKKTGCDSYYYEFNYPIWSEYDYHIEVSECTQQKDTLFITDFNSTRIVAFKKLQ